MNKTIFPMTGNMGDVSNKNLEVFKTVIGQPEACKKLGFFIDSHSEATPFPTMLFSGSQGLGKSYMAKKVAAKPVKKPVKKKGKC